VGVSLRLAAFVSQNSGLKHQAFRSQPGAIATEPTPTPLVASNFNNRERVSVVFRSRSNAELNEVLWDSLRAAVLVVPAPILSSSTGRGDGQKSVHELVGCMAEAGRKRATLRGTIGLANSSLRRIGDWEEKTGAAQNAPAASNNTRRNNSANKEGDWDDEITRIVARGEATASSMGERWKVLGRRSYE
jgi:hypothetical protein